MKRLVAPATFAAAVGGGLAAAALALAGAPDAWWRTVLALTLAALAVGAWLAYRVARGLVRDVARVRAEQKRARQEAAARVSEGEDARRRAQRAQRAQDEVVAALVERVGGLDALLRESLWLAAETHDRRVQDAEQRAQLAEQLAAAAEQRAVAAEQRAAAAERHPAWLEIGRSTGTESA